MLFAFEEIENLPFIIIHYRGLLNNLLLLVL